MNFTTSERAKHRPIHYYKDDSIYFTTIRTIHHQNYFNSVDRKSVVLETIAKSVEKFNVDLYAWVILDNHFHILFKLNRGINLAKFIHNIESNTARLLNQIDKILGRKIFSQYWDYCIRNEANFWKHFNYIHNNPIKHNYINNPNKLFLYEFSSYNQWIKKRGKEWIDSCFAEYPVIDFTVDD